MKLMGFQFTFIISASIMATSVVCGFIFFNKEDDDDVEEEKEHDECDKEKLKRRRSSSIGARINLKIKGKKTFSLSSHFRIRLQRTNLLNLNSAYYYILRNPMIAHN